MSSTSTITLSKKALAENIKFLRDFFDPKVRISSVVKGNAYGHGIEQLVPMAEEMGIDHFSVHSIDEAQLVHEVKNNASTEIMIMGYLSDADMEWVLKNKVSFFVFDFDRLHCAANTAKALGLKARVHIELETGMNRTGFGPEHMEELSALLLANKNHVIFEGLCTHFAGAENISNLKRVEKQKEQFMALCELLRSKGLKPKIKHACCSAASMRMPEMHLDLVRIGILQYGFWPSQETFIEYIHQNNLKEDPLKRVIEWTTEVMNIKWVKSNEFIGYGTTYLAQRDTRIAIIPVGYSHGFSRSLSNQGRLLLNGIRVQVVGMVNMNNLAIDITDIPNVQKGDCVTIIGKNGEQEVSVSSFSEMSDQLNYELLTRLPSKIPRLIK
ncbi:MAG: alanine racemase [Marinoscillum sp.]|jgi:alanine racemase